MVKEGKRASPLHHISLFQTVTGNQRRQDVESVRHRPFLQSLAVNSAAFSFFVLLGAGVCRSTEVKKRGVARCLSSLDGSELILSHLQLRTRFGRVGILFPPPLHLLFCEYSCFRRPFYSVLIFGRADINLEICIYQVNKCVCWGSCAIRALEAKSGVSKA